jgi:hypothetical protein
VKVKDHLRNPNSTYAVPVSGYERDQPAQVHLIACIDCGLEFEYEQLPGRIKQRCEACADKRRRELARARVRKHRAK